MNRLPLPMRITANAAASVILAFLVLPVLAVLPASFNRSSFIHLPPHSYSLIWYQNFFADPEWLDASRVSLIVALLATLLAVPLGTLAAIGLRLLSDRIGRFVNALFLAPIIVPVIVTGVALYRSALDLGLNGTILGIALGHAVLALPFVVINVGIALRGVDPHWLNAAAGLGANSWVVFWTITFPTISPGIVGGAIFSFLISFDEAVVSIFMTGYGNKTLPVKIWEAVRLDFSPVIAVGATLLIVLTLVLFALAKSLSPGEKAPTS